MKIINFAQRWASEEAQTQGWSSGTCRIVATFLSHLERFCTDCIGQALLGNDGLEFFDEEGLGRFIAWLRSRGMEESSVSKQYKMLTWMLRWASRKRLPCPDAFQTFRPKFRIVEKPIVFLEKEELLRLLHLSIPPGIKERAALAKARDLFCFSCLTSLRYSDVVEVRRSDIQGRLLTVTTRKTSDRLPIILHEQALQILRRYSAQNLPDGRALPYMTNQQMNRCLKVLGQLCGLSTPYTVVRYRGGKRESQTYAKWQLLGTHCGRRTFICFALSNGIPPDVVMKFTGHSDYNAMKPYIAITDSARQAAIRRLEAALR